ncbi:MAG: hypothetical protein CM15mP55_0500 [Hyphomicrobiales bacterium]|nr:MAG: hypothetical protein CM15mP55_0500 [Hyphomicrobiales bacterium]
MLDAGPVAPSAELGIERSVMTARAAICCGRQNLENPQIMAIPGPNDVFGTPHISARHPSSFLIEMPAWSVLDQTMIGRIVEVIVRDGERAVFKNPNRQTTVFRANKQQGIIKETFHDHQTRRRHADAQLMYMTDAGPAPISTGDLFGGKTVALFALPGAFTPTCSNQHLPGYVDKAEDLRARAWIPLSVWPSMMRLSWGLGASNKVPMASYDGG